MPSVRRAPGVTSTERFFNTETGERLAHPIVPKAISTRLLTGNERTATWPSIFGAKMDEFFKWSSQPTRKNEGCWVRQYVLSEKEHSRFSGGYLNTQRTSDGKPLKPARRDKELGDGESMTLTCIVCGVSSGDKWRGMPRTISAVHFVNDHVDDEEPTWLTEARADFCRDQIMEGKAQRLCIICNAHKTHDTEAGQGDSTSHTARESFLDNVKKYGHLLPDHVQHRYRHLMPSSKKQKREAVELDDEWLSAADDDAEMVTAPPPAPPPPPPRERAVSGQCGVDGCHLPLGHKGTCQITGLKPRPRPQWGHHRELY